MADPLSGVASALGIITFGLSVCKRISETYDFVRDSRQDIRVLCSSANLLGRILTTLQEIVSQSQLHGDAVGLVEECIAACKNELTALDQQLQKIGKSASDPAALTVHIFLRYAFREKTISRLNLRIHQGLLSHLLTAIESLNLQNSVSIRREIGTLSLSVRDIEQLNTAIEDGFRTLQSGIDNIADIAAAERLEDQRNRIIAWVASADIVGDFHHAACEKCERGTGEWFFKRVSYQKWRDDLRSFLWIHGLPGCGKTILCSTIIAETVSYCSVRPDHQFAYFYFSFTDPDRQSTEKCFRAILRQLLLQHQVVPDGVRDEFTKHGYSYTPLESWKRALRSVVQGPRTSYIIIDALDECPTRSEQRMKCLEFLKYLAASSSSNLHILVTSRKEEDIETALEECITLPPLEIQDADVENDVRIHVSAQLSSDNTMKSWPETIKCEVEEALTTKSGGMFRWVSCQLDSLRKCLRPSSVRKTLSELPHDLDETYERILLSIDPNYQQEAKTALIWLTASRRGLTVAELAEAVSIGTESEEPFDPANRLFNPNAIPRILSGLVSLIPSNQYDEPAVICLSHFSVEEYLLSDRLKSSAASMFHVEFESSHIRLATASLQYLKWANGSARELERWPLAFFAPVGKDEHLYGIGTEIWPLLNYACNHWNIHLRLSENVLTDKEIRLVIDFLECAERMMLFIKATYEDTDRAADIGCRSSKEVVEGSDLFSISSLEFPEPARPLYYAARLGLVGVTKVLLKGFDVDQGAGNDLISSQEQSETPAAGRLGDELRIACYYNRQEIVDLLLSHGANFEARGGRFRDVLGACMECSTPDPVLIERVLEAITSLSVRDINVGWAIRWAAIEGHLSVVVKVLSKLDKLEQETYEWTRSHIQGTSKWTRILSGHMHWYGLHPRRDNGGVDSYPNRGTAPYQAAMAGHRDILLALISNWTNIDEADDEGRTSLYWAVFNGHTEVVKLLLSHGASTRGHRSVREWTPAYWAREKGFSEIEQLLINHEDSLPGSILSTEPLSVRARAPQAAREAAETEPGQPDRDLLINLS